MNETSQSLSLTSVIHQGAAALQALNAYLKGGKYKGTTIFILTDENCGRYCLPLLQQEIPVLAEARVMEIKGEEDDKSIDTCIEIWTWLTESQADRKALVINLGGGIVADLGGFAAATYKRGISFINIPTTLLSQVDAAVGGKTAINFLGHKNLVGVFRHPKAIFLYPGFLETLPRRQLLSGLAEIVKHALILDARYWKDILSTDIEKVEEVGKLVGRSIEIKSEVVLKDPREKGLRKVLNFGHTVGHAIESCSMEEGRPLLHGEAVAIGIVCESYLSYKHAGLDHAVLDDICSYILSTFPVYEIESNHYHRLVQLMRNDKKNSDRQINFSLIRSIGEAVYDQPMEIDDIIRSMQFYNEKISLMLREK